MKHRVPVAVLALSTLVAAPAALAVSETFATYCAECHGEDGKAQTKEGKEKGARSFADKKWQEAVDDARLEKSIHKGRGKMPSFKGKLSDEEIKALVQEVRAFGK